MKKLSFKVVVLLAVIVMTMLAGTITSSAVESSNNIKINIVEQQAKLALKGDASTSYVSLTEATQYTRSKLVQRNTNFTVMMSVSQSANINSAINQMINDAVYVHTGNVLEGDYIRHNIAEVDIEYSWHIGSSEIYIKLTVLPKYRTTASQENTVTNKVNSWVNSNISSGMTDYQKAKKIYDYVCSNVTYDHDFNALSYTAYGAIVNKSAVCQGYALMFYRMAEAAGLDCRIIPGTASSKGAHAWNIVKIGSAYYNVDTTWDAGMSKYEYFLVTNSTLGHYREAEFTESDFCSKYPMAGGDYVTCTGISLNKTKLIKLTTDSAEKITVTFSPSNATNKNIVWSSSNKSVAKVDSNGNVTPAKISSRYASATITAKHAESGKKAKCVVHVYNTAAQAKSFSGIKDTAILTKYKIPELNSTFCPQGLCMTDNYVFITAYDRRNEWSSRIYVISRSTGKLINTAHIDSLSHVGGIAYDPAGKYLVVCANEKDPKSGSTTNRLNFYKVNAVVKAAYYCPSANMKRKLDFKASFVTCYDGKVWVGKFSKILNTPLKTYAYNKSKKKYDFKRRYTMKIKSVQGICFSNQGQMYVSSSSGRHNNSKLYKAKKGVSGYYATHYVKIPNMSQNIVCKKIDGSNYMFVLYESAFKTYMNALDGESQKTIYPVDKVMRMKVSKIKWTKK